MSEIYDFPLSYNFAKRYIAFVLKCYYGEFLVVGKENIPSNSPIIFAPNHTNALMDALLVHAVAPHKMPIVFLARADIFNNKWLAKVLHFFKIMPAFRLRDGMENLGRNQAVFDTCVEILDKNKALGIMPEGNQEIERRLRPLVKGIFRIAFAAQHKFGADKSVKIVPVGLDFECLEKAGKAVVVSIAKPIDVADYMTAYALNPVKATNEIRERLQKELSEVSLDLATDSYYSSFEMAIEVCSSSFLKSQNQEVSVFSKFVARKQIAKKLVLIEQNNPTLMSEIDFLCTEYSTLLKNYNFKDWVLEQKAMSVGSFFVSYLGLILTMPIFILGFCLNFLPFFLPVFLRKKVFKTQFSGFFSSLQFVLGLFTFPLFYLLQTLIIGIFCHLSWWLVLLLLAMHYPMGKMALRWNSMATKLNVQLRLKRLEHLNDIGLKQLYKVRKKIIELVLGNV